MIKERPKYNSAETNNLFRKSVEIVLRAYDDGYKEDTFDEAVEDVIEVLSYERDPFRATKELDNLSWTGDAALYDAIDNLIVKKSEAYQAAIEKWVADNQIKPEFAVGDTVKFKSQGREYTGTIVSIYEKRADYSIFCEEMGHVKSGCGRLGIIIPYENVTNKDF